MHSYLNKGTSERHFRRERTGATEPSLPASIPPLDLGRVVIAKPQFVIGRSRKSWARFHHFVAGAAELGPGGVRRDTDGRCPIDSMVSRLDAIAARRWRLFLPLPSQLEMVDETENTG